jgi:hypothetical protein
MNLAAETIVDVCTRGLGEFTGLPNSYGGQHIILLLSSEWTYAKKASLHYQYFEEMCLNSNIIYRIVLKIEFLSKYRFR